MADETSMWNFSDSDPNLDFQFDTPSNSEDNSESMPLAGHIQHNSKHSSSIRLTPDKPNITFGDEILTIIDKRKQVAHKTLCDEHRNQEHIKTLYSLLQDQNQPIHYILSPSKQTQ